MPLDQRADETKSLTFTSAPFERDTELTGEPEVLLHVSSSAESGYFHAKISDVAPDGTSKWLTDGGLFDVDAFAYVPVEADLEPVSQS